jgi:5-methylcytosine-specific restriction endonuclease McrA
MCKKPCQRCGRPVSRNNKKFCGLACFYKTRNPSWEPGGKTCKACGKRLPNRKKVYCSPECRKYNSKKEFKIKKLCSVCENEFFTYKTRPKRYCSVICSKKAQSVRQLGEKSHLWKGGKTDHKRHIREHNLYKEWRMRVFRRDDFTCQDCKISSSDKRQPKLTAHHRIPFSVNPKTVFKVSNGITLCWDCHKKRHKENGYKKVG